MTTKESQETPPRPPEGVAGSTGKPTRSGRPYGYEHNRRLMDGGFIADFRKMMRSPAPSKAFGLQRDLLLSADWTVDVPKGASQIAGEIMRRQFGLDEAAGAGELDAPFEEYVADMLEFAPAGFALFEEEYHAADGQDWLTGWRKREQDSIDRWELDYSERMVGVWQKPVFAQYADGGLAAQRRFIPANRLLHLVQYGSPTNPEGIGDFRPIWASWREQEKVYNLMMAGAQRYAIPSLDVLIDIKIAEAHSAIDRPVREWLQAEIAAATSWAEKYAAGERAYIVRPPWWVIGTFGANSLDVYQLVRQVEHYERVQLTAGFAQFLQLGSAGSGGSYSLGQVGVDTAIQAAQNKLDVVMNRINGPGRPGRGTVGRLLEWNLKGLKPSEYPRLRYTGIKAKPFLEKLAELPALVGAGLLTRSPKTEEHIRDETGLPALEEDYQPTQFDRMGVNPLTTEIGQRQRSTRAPDGPLVER